ncbi:MAG TPA: response regulator [Elusimicrobiales bacterium]|nr:response regulator [Elusimicrobiales bacterium]
MAKKILIVEDEPDLRGLTEIFLKRAGYETISCENGRDVFPILETDKPDLIIMDVMLPGMDGLSLSKALAADPEKSKIPLLAVTALTQTKMTFEQLPQCQGFISKPFDMEQLLQKVQQILG